MKQALQWTAVHCCITDLLPYLYPAGARCWDVCVCHLMSVALVVVVSSLVLIRNARQASRLRYPLKNYPALVPELLLAAVKAFAYG